MNKVEHPKRMSKTKEYLLFAIWILIIFGGIELTFRAVYHAMDRKRGIITDAGTYLPYVGFRRAPNFERNGIKHDRYGFQLNHLDEDRDLQIKPANEFRIFMMGGSTVEGRNLDTPQDSLPARLENKLTAIFNSSGIPLIPKVINAGMSSYFSGQELSSFIYQILPAKPDFVIYFNGVNDFINWGENDSPAFALYQNNYHDFQAEFFEIFNDFYTLEGTVAALFKNATSHSAAMDFLFKAITRFDRLKNIVTTQSVNEEQFNAMIDKFMPTHIERYRRNILSSIGAAFPFDIGISYILQPTLLGVEPQSAKEKFIFDNVRIKWHNINYNKARRIFYDRARNIFAETGRRYEDNPLVSIHDMSRAFDDKNSEVSYYSDRAHYFNVAREKLVEDMTNKISAQIVFHARKRVAKP